MAQDRARDVAAIERVTRRLQAGKAIAIRVRPLLIRHVLQRAAEIALHENLAHLGRASAGQEDRRRARPLRKIVLPDGELFGQERIGREPIAREADRRRGHLAERHRPEARQCGDPDARRRWNHGVQQPLGDASAKVPMEMLDVGSLRPDTDAADHVGFGAFAQMDHHRRDAAETDELAFQHIDREAGCDARIDRVAACLQHLQAGERCVVVPRHHHMAPRHHIGTARPSRAEQIGRVEQPPNPAACPCRPTATAAPTATRPGAGSASAPTCGSPSSRCPPSAARRPVTSPRPAAPRR